MTQAESAWLERAILVVMRAAVYSVAAAIALAAWLVRELRAYAWRPFWFEDEE